MVLNECFRTREEFLEVDFLIRHHGECTTLEVKAKSGKSKSLSTVINNPQHYHVSHAVKFGNYNIGHEGALLTLPLYMGFFIDFDTDADIQFEDLDIDAINALAEEILKP